MTERFKTIENKKVPIDSKPIVIKTEVVGIETADGSFDYSKKGEIFLKQDNIRRS